MNRLKKTWRAFVRTRLCLVRLILAGYTPLGVASSLRRVKSKAPALQNTKDGNVK
jgi:hypothetical protein